MTKQDYVFIATTIRGLPVNMRRVTARAFADRLETHSDFRGENFSRAKFISYILGDSPEHTKALRKMLS